jgi:hypothetical protein
MRTKHDIALSVAISLRRYRKLRKLKAPKAILMYELRLLAKRLRALEVALR